MPAARARASRKHLTEYQGWPKGIYPMSDGWVPPCYPKEEELIEYEEKMKARKKATLVKRHLCVKEPQLQRLSKRAFAQKSEYSMLAYAIAEGEYSGEGDDRSYFVIVFYEPAKKSKVERAFKSVGAALADYEQVVVDPDSKMEQEEKFMFAHGAGDPGECILGEYEYQVVPKGSPEYDDPWGPTHPEGCLGLVAAVPFHKTGRFLWYDLGELQLLWLFWPGVAPIEYAEGARVELKVNKLTSVKTQLPYGYYTLPFCKPDSGIVESVENLGEILAGDLIENSPFDLRMGEDEKCKMLCKKPLEAADKDKFRSRIDDEYLVNFIVDNLPAATKYVRKSDGGEFTYMNGFPIGVQKDGKYYLYNHLKLDLKYHSSDTYEGHRIVGFEIEPRSVVQATQADPTKPGGLKAVCQEGADAQLMELDMFNEVIFSYDVTWEYSENRWVSRWDNYLKMTGGQIHWFSILNSLMIMLFLSGMVAMILLRTLYRDITKYNELATAEEAAEDCHVHEVVPSKISRNAAALQETGWKLVHGDVFRKPRFGRWAESLLCSRRLGQALGSFESLRLLRQAVGSLCRLGSLGLRCCQGCSKAEVHVASVSGVESCQVACSCARFGFCQQHLKPA
ncbi:TMN10 [Symbiodinium sp. CCMP2592]|nr:TMN10 [Symbiodinium sp. CCMP2592]